MVRISILAIFFLLSLYGVGAQIQQSNVYLFDMKPRGDGTFDFSNPRWVTHFNRNGYNNHPYFMDDNLLFLSVQTPTQAQPDLFAFNLRDTSQLRITATNEGEYSPERTPDYNNLSVIRMEFTSQDTVLRLWQFPLRRQPGDNGKPVFRYLTNVGYYQWINPRQVAVYIVENPAYLGVVDLQSPNEEVSKRATNVGRTFRVQPNGRLLFVQKNTAGPWQLMEFNLATASETPARVIDMLPGTEDFAVMADGTILTGSGSKLFKFNRAADTDWVELADFSYYNINSISRLAVSPGGRLAVVAR